MANATPAAVLIGLAVAFADRVGCYRLPEDLIYWRPAAGTVWGEFAFTWVNGRPRAFVRPSPT
jgi:hypothetical protein